MEDLARDTASETLKAERDDDEAYRNGYHDGKEAAEERAASEGHERGEAAERTRGYYDLKDVAKRCSAGMDCPAAQKVRTIDEQDEYRRLRGREREEALERSGMGKAVMGLKMGYGADGPRTEGEIAEWNRKREEEEPEIWDEAVARKEAESG